MAHTSYVPHSRWPISCVLATALTIGVLDFVWLSQRQTYHDTLFRTVQGTQLTVRWIPAVCIYLLLPVILYIYAIQPSHTTAEALQHGALIGFFLYIFYDLTNYATLQGWTLEMTLTDALWGTVLCAVASAVGFYVVYA